MKRASNALPCDYRQVLMAGFVQQAIERLKQKLFTKKENLPIACFDMLAGTPPQI